MHESLSEWLTEPIRGIPRFMAGKAGKAGKAGRQAGRQAGKAGKAGRQAGRQAGHKNWLIEDARQAARWTCLDLDRWTCLDLDRFSAIFCG